MADLHMAEADKDAARHGAVPDRRVIQREKPNLVQIGLHVQQQTGAGYEIHLQNVVRQRHDGGQIPSLQRTPPFPAFPKIKNPLYNQCTVDFKKKTLTKG